MRQIRLNPIGCKIYHLHCLRQQGCHDFRCKARLSSQVFKKCYICSLLEKIIVTKAMQPDEAKACSNWCKMIRIEVQIHQHKMWYCLKCKLFHTRFEHCAASSQDRGTRLPSLGL